MPDVALDASTRARYLETARREAGRLERIVADLIDLARHEHGASAIEPRVFAIERVFDHVIRRHEREAAAAGVVLTAEVAPEADQVYADPGRLEQVIGNLVANALRHTPPGGAIRREAALGPDCYRLAVQDSGDGIPESHLPTYSTASTRPTRRGPAATAAAGSACRSSKRSSSVTAAQST